MSSIRQLINYFVPDNYQLHLSISKTQRHFTGTVTITGRHQKDEVRLHAKGLTIDSVTTNTNSNPTWQLTSDELIIAEPADKITVSFAGKIDETAMNGLYLCRYQIGGQDRELFATQFESHYARECFPCIDEPDAKATFDITITTDDPDDKIVLSNMPGRLTNGIWHFDTTPRMSTYLLAFVGGDLISKTGQTNRGTLVSAYATPAQPAESLDYALQTAIKSIEFYEDYFGINYPLPKLDNVALPDFSAGAMENWGLITYNESAMLVANNAAQDTIESIATVITHEISHQWFGNLVTMKWWNDLWLNESFASLMENTAVDHIYPEYEIWHSFETGGTLAALKQDALTGVQSVQQEATTVDEIATLFDSAIVYAKGERLLRMLQAYIGEAAFRRGLTNYFQKYQYSNTTADQLWHELSLTSGINIKELMDPWLTQPGYPLVTVSLNNGQLEISQNTFSIDNNIKDDKTWPLPLFASTTSLPRLLTNKQLSISNYANTDCLQLNVGNYAHYITHYDDQTTKSLTNSFTNLAITDKIKLLQEAMLLSLASRQSIEPLINLLREAFNEHSSAVLETMSWTIGNLSLLVEPESDERVALKQFVEQLFSQQFEQLFVATNNFPSIDNRKSLSTVLARSVYGDNQKAIHYCINLFKRHADDPDDIPGDIRPTVLATAVKHIDGAFDKLWQLYRVSQDADLRHDIRAGLTSTKNKQQISLLLSNITNTSIVRPQDVIYFTAWLMANPYARTDTWQWLQSNWPWIKRVFSGDMTYDDFVRSAGSNLRTSIELAEYDQFYKQVSASDPSLSRSIQIGHNNIASRIRWITDNKPILHQNLSD